MTISPPTDIVLDVIRASEPKQQQAATQRLRRMAGAASTEGTQHVIRPAAAKLSKLSFDSDGAVVARRNQSSLSGQSSASTRVGVPQQQFEAMVLQEFVHKMLPTKTEATYGSGTAGSIWKSWMAEAVANEVAAAGGIGVSRMLDAAPVASQDKPVKLAASTSPLARSAPSLERIDTGMSSQPDAFSDFRKIVARLQEVFLDLLGGHVSAGSSNVERSHSRPTLDV